MHLHPSHLNYACYSYKVKTIISRALKGLPDSPGIYKFKNAKGEILYVGKAKNLRSRVRTYFQTGGQASVRTRKLVENTTDFEYTQTNTELDALMLETNLIKELRPKYNILMKDDKSYVYVKVNMDEDFPRIHVVRQREAESAGAAKNSAAHGLARASVNSRYFGPKLTSSHVYETLRILKKLFPFRHCQLDIKWRGAAKAAEPAPEATPAAGENPPPAADKNLVEVKNRVIDFPCLDYYIKRCPGPCIGAITPEAYKKVVQQIVDFLDGNTEVLENSIKEQMNAAAQKKLFEKAAMLRDKLFAIRTIAQRQSITDPLRRDTDAINFTVEMGRVYFNTFQVRNGKVTGQENFVLDAFEADKTDMRLDSGEILNSFIAQYYEKAAYIPKEILIPELPADSEIAAHWLSKIRGDKVYLLAPERGEKNKLLELSHKNAVSFAAQYRIKWLQENARSGALKALAEALGIKRKTLNRIEGYDISHLGGENTVASMVVMENGAAKSEHYRHFKMRTVIGKPDDCRSMEEVLMRRLKYLQHPKNIVIRKARAANMKLILEWLGENKWEEKYDKNYWEDFFILHKDKKPAGMLCCRELKKGIFELAALYIAPAFRGEKLSYALLEKVIEKIKNRKARFYLFADEKRADHYLEFGFSEVNFAPEIFMKEFRNREAKHNKKYKILAYYKATKRKTDPSFSSKPDLIVVDGGKGQLGVALHALKRLRLEIPVIALAKRLEEIYIPGAKAPLLLEEGDEALKILQRLRDEAHRFAITFQRDLHRKSMFAQ